MAALPEKTLDLDEEPVTLDQSFDTDRYFRTEKKDWSIKSMERYMKKASIDCHIHKKRNIVSGEQDYTPECD